MFVKNRIRKRQAHWKYVHVCACLFTYDCMCLCMPVCFVYVCVWLFIHMCAQTCMYVFLYDVFVHACVFFKNLLLHVQKWSKCLCPFFLKPYSKEDEFQTHHQSQERYQQSVRSLVIKMKEADIKLAENAASIHVPPENQMVQYKVSKESIKKKTCSWSVDSHVIR